MSDLRDHLLDLLTDAAHEADCITHDYPAWECNCAVGALRDFVDGLEPTFRRPQ